MIKFLKIKKQNKKIKKLIINNIKKIIDKNNFRLGEMFINLKELLQNL